MSSNKKTTEQNEKKVITKYDLKQQRKEEQKIKEQKEKKRSAIIKVVVIALLVCFIASFPIHTYSVLNNTYITVGDEKITKVEFDYHYNITKNSYLNEYGSYMSYFGVDVTAPDFEDQMYSDTLTWRDFLEQMTVDNLIEGKAIKAEAAAAGFAPETDEEFENFKASIIVAAEMAGVSQKDYIRATYGSNATMNRIEDFVRESIVNTAYFAQIEESKAPTDEEVQTQYDNNTDSYDSVDYRITTINAELSSETPTDEEVKKAMAEAKKQADEAEKTVATEGTLHQGVTKTLTASLLSDWLFDSARKEGETTVIEDSTSNRYYAVAFEKRYLDQTPSADVRVIVSEDKSGEEILNEWKSGAATEDSFIELCATYSVDSTAYSGGLYNGLTKSYAPAEIQEWLYDKSRVTGDTFAVSAEDGSYHYVAYYVGQNDPEWKINIYNALLNEALSDYLAEISANVEIKDPKGNLNYLKVAAE